MTQLALSNEEVVNLGVASAEKLFVHLRSKLSGVNRSLSTELNRICSSWSGLLETSVLQKGWTPAKILCSKKIFPLASTEKLFSLLLVVYRILQKGAQASTEPGAARSFAVASDNYCNCWYPAEVGQQYLSYKFFSSLVYCQGSICSTGFYYRLHIFTDRLPAMAYSSCVKRL